MTDPTIEARLNRLEGLFASGGELMLKTSEVAQCNVEQISRLGRAIDRAIDNGSQLILKTSEVAQRNAEQISRLEHTMSQLVLKATNDRAEFEEFRRTTQSTLASTRAALEKIDRVLDYLMGQRDNPPSDE